MLRRFALPALTLPLLLLLVPAGPAAGADLTPSERLGKLLFFEKSLSANGNQSCATCHAPEAGWTGPDEAINKGGGVYEGSVAGRFGSRKPPSVAYSTMSPKLRRGPGGDFTGGHFWDGRATGEQLGSAAADQALGPFLNPMEQTLPDAAAVVRAVCAGSYAALFKEVWGKEACAHPESAFGNIGRSIAAFEASREVDLFRSRFDAFRAGKAALTPEEKRGLDLFEGKAKCAICHRSRPGPIGEPPLFTDFGFDNIGVPRNPANPFYANRAANPLGPAWTDLGLGGFLLTVPAHAGAARQEIGKHKTPTLRNVDLRPSPGFVKCYGHNGYFKSLKEIVHFYNTRDVLPPCGEEDPKPGLGCWPLPETNLNLNVADMGNLGLSDAEENAVVAFLKTLSDEPPPAMK
ncbi:MAG TPA: cytochrome c peroxidase [Thermoanaerobaculia bacterium]|nr:cytochrome c peroxidase [Thermoanaerobaculia bacterium]